MAGDGSEPGAQLEPLDDFVRRVTSTFDFSHDYNHAVEVTKLAQRIGEKELDAQTWASAQRIILYAGRSGPEIRYPEAERLYLGPKSSLPTLSPTLSIPCIYSLILYASCLTPADASTLYRYAA